MAMAKAKTKAPVKQTKKDVAAEVISLLSISLAKFKKNLGEKKFDKKVKKAAKLFVEALKSSKEKKAVVPQKIAKKTTAAKK